MSKSKFEVHFSTIVFFVFLMLLVFTLNMLFFNYVIDLESAFLWPTYFFMALISTGICMVFISMVLKRNYSRNGSTDQSKALIGAMWTVIGLLLLPLLLLINDYRNLFRIRSSNTPAECLEQNFDQIIQSSDSKLDSNMLRDAIELFKDTAHLGWILISDPKGGFKYRMPNKGYIKDSGVVSFKQESYKYKYSVLSPVHDADPNEVYSIRIINLKLDRSKDNVTSFIEWITAEWPEFQQMIIVKKELFVYKGQSAIRMEMYQKGSECLHTVNLYFSNSRVYILKVVTARSKLPNDKIGKFFTGFDFNPHI
ncbi:MAG TPA: hypothetical protein VGF79_08250 [Bacteroidia bacterium]